MKNITYKNIIMIFLLFIVFIILNTGNSKAVLQSNGNASATYGVNEWMMNVRRMESLGGAMGLSEGISANLTANGNSNNIDVHMEKNTEYGALAILSASSYGKSNKVNDWETTTGNATGVVMRLNKEWVAAGSIAAAPNYNNAVSRYKNIYTETYTRKVGDAITETSGWHGSTSSIWMTDGSSGVSVYRPGLYNGLVRSYSGSIFSYYAIALLSISGDGQQFDAYYTQKHPTRAVIVSGEGL